MKATPIPFVNDSAGLPTKPIMTRRNARLTRRTANHGTIVPMYFTAPAVEMKIVAMMNEINRTNHLFSPRIFVFIKTENTIRKTIRNARIGAKYDMADKSAGILVYCDSSLQTLNFALPLFVSLLFCPPLVETAIITPTSKTNRIM